MGITIHNEKQVVTEPYLLGRDAAESRRLRDQHDVLLKAAGGYLPISLSAEPRLFTSILDIGTANSLWLVGLRQSGIVTEDVDLCGIDISDEMMLEVMEERRFRLKLMVHDVCKPFPSHWNWSGKFDFIHVRHVMIWIEPYKWLGVLKNLRQALKPGGTLLIMYPGEIPYDVDTDAPLEKDTAPMKLFSAFVRCADYRGLPRSETANLRSVLQQAGFDPSSIVSQRKKIKLGGAEPDPALRPAASRHLDFVPEKTRENSRKISFVDLGCPSYDDEDGWRELKNNWQSSIEKGFYYDLHMIFAQRVTDDCPTKSCPSPLSCTSSEVSSDL